jgi:signal peptidase I
MWLFYSIVSTCTPKPVDVMEFISSFSLAIYRRRGASPTVAAAATVATAQSRRAIWATTALASLPLVVWFRESMFSLARIQGTSMEPCLQDGDVILVRKSDRGVFIDSFMKLIVGVGSASSEQARSEKGKLLQSEVNRGLLQYAPIAEFYERPPAALTGHVVVYKSPLHAFPNQLTVKQVIGLGGQYARRSAGNNNRHMPPMTLISVPDYSIYVEGDNKANSMDSRNPVHGAVSKNLLVEMAEYIVWSPSRWQRIHREPEKDGVNGKPRAYWL